MQWHALVGSPDPFNFKSSLWRGGDPDCGNLAPHSLEALCEFLGAHTQDAAHCFFGLWVGWAWVECGSVRLTSRRAGARYISTAKPADPKPIDCIPPAFSADELELASSAAPRP